MRSILSERAVFSEDKPNESSSICDHKDDSKENITLRAAVIAWHNAERKSYLTSAIASTI